MGIAQAIALAWKILGVALTILGIANDLNAKPVAEEGHPLEIQTAVLATGQFLVDPVLGIPRVISNQAALLAALGSVQTTLLAAIGSPAQAGTAPSWWIAPPTPSTAPSSADNADAVWTYLLPYASLSAQDALFGIWRKQKIESDSFIVGGGSKTWMGVNGFMVSTNSSFPDDGPPEPDWRNLRPTDTLIGFLEREWAGPTWFYDARFGYYGFNDGNTLSGLVWYCTITQEEFELMKRQLGSAASASAPVWPGFAGVTLGTPVALSPTCVVTGPMHGVIIEITSAAPRQVYQVFGGMQGYRFVGGLQFVDDNGEAERIQSIGMQHEVIVCKSMAEAASCSIRTDSAVTGTATPFVIM